MYRTIHDTIRDTIQKLGLPIHDTIHDSTTMLRTNYEVSDPDSVLEGDLDGFILSYLSASLDKNEGEA